MQTRRYRCRREHWLDWQCTQQHLYLCIFLNPGFLAREAHSSESNTTNSLLNNFRILYYTDLQNDKFARDPYDPHPPLKGRSQCISQAKFIDYMMQRVGLSLLKILKNNVHENPTGNRTHIQ